jgi:uncharacterized protein YndB with AHSA1/START domain
MASSALNAAIDTVPALRMTRRFAAPREAVFKAWTDPDELAQWFGPAGITVPEINIDLRTGGAYNLLMVGEKSTHPLSGVYHEIKAPERLVFTWIWGAGDLDGIEMLVTVDFDDTADGGTLLTLTHERLPSVEAGEHHTQGWTGCFDSLQAYLVK